MKIKTSELTGAALDWAVAKCEDMGTHLRNLMEASQEDSNCRVLACCLHEETLYEWGPSTNWIQGGPIIEREGIDLYWMQHGTPDFKASWQARKVNVGQMFSGPTPLIAAMRCYVASKLGDEVEIPEELC